MKTAFLFFFTLAIVQYSFAQSPVKYSAQSVKDDFEYLYKTLEASHYNLFVSTPKTKFDIEYQKTYNSINDSLNGLQIGRLFQPFIALSKISHCTSDLGYLFDDVYHSYMKSGGTFFPINITVIDNKMLITDNYSVNKNIKIGDEIISINGKSASSILDNVYSFLSGENNYFINTIIDIGTFPRLNWVLNEPCDSYNIQIKNQNNESVNFNVNAIKAGKFEELQSSRKQVFNSGRKFKFIDGIAYVQPGMFLNVKGDGDLMNIKTHDNGEFLTFIDSAFHEIAKRKSKNLIIDLRDNSGGDNTFSDEMVSYFANKPFKWCGKFSVKTSEKTKEAWKQINDSTYNYLKEMILNRANGDIFDVELHEHDFRKDSLKFSGNVYVLINKYSYSQANLTAAQIQDYKFGILIGEKTAGMPTSYSSSQMFKLPNTKIKIQYPKALVVRPNGDTEFEGVTPDIIVEDNIFTEEDEILNYTLNLIRKGE